MEDFFYRFYSYGIILQLLAIVHFAKRRPNMYWLWIIFIGGGLGALAYFLVEVVPELSNPGTQFSWWTRRKRIRQMQTVILDNPAPGNYEELADLYFDDKQYQLARDAYNQAITPRTDNLDPFYRRAQCNLELKQYPDALSDLEHVYAKNPKFDFGRVQGLLAHAYAMSGREADAEAHFAAATQASTISETMYNYADFLRARGRNQEARQWLEKIVNKQATLPRYLKRRERPWYWRAVATLKQLPR